MQGFGRLLGCTEYNDAVSTIPQVTPQVEQLLNVLQGEMTRGQLQKGLGLQDRRSLSARDLKPAIKEGLIEMTIPDKPNTRLQKYRITDNGLAWRKHSNHE